MLFSLFSLYDKIKGVLGLGDFGGWVIEDDEDEDRGEVISVVEGRSILKRELGLTSGGGVRTTRRARPPRVERRAFRDEPGDEDEDDDSGGENFFVATGHRLWNSISNRVDDLRTEDEGRGEGDGEESGGLLGRIARPKWMQRGDSGASVWRLPKWGRGNDEGRVVL